MARTPKVDRLSPPLMFAFRERHRPRIVEDSGDDQPGWHARVNAITEDDLREELKIDLSALMNTINMASGVDLTDHPWVRRSILNYGIPEISRRTIDDYRVADIAGEIREALLQFEPRLVPESLTVTHDADAGSASLTVRFFVSGEMKADPAAVAVAFVADIELDTGKMRLARR
jgi:type VI secretion system protein ImpF